MSALQCRSLSKHETKENKTERVSANLLNCLDRSYTGTIFIPLSRQLKFLHDIVTAQMIHGNSDLCFPPTPGLCAVVHILDKQPVMEGKHKPHP